MKARHFRHFRLFGSGLNRVWVFAALLGLSVGARGEIPTTMDDFFLKGTQPDTSNGEEFDPILTSFYCLACHDLPEPVEVPIYNRWRPSMMANSARDPLFHACLAIANQDAPFSGDLCLRCHAPGAWLAGRSTPTDGSALNDDDLDGITCNFCHRLVDPVFTPGVSPRQDRPILDALTQAGLLPIENGNASYIVSPDDVRRGPFFDVPLNLHGVPIIASLFHTTSEICGTCHHVSNPMYVLQPNGSYALDPVGVPHPSQGGDPKTADAKMFPHDRTFAEWANSQYATVGVNHGGIFGGNHPTGIMRTCQDCHMPDQETWGCGLQKEPFFVRENVPGHDFNGGNTWMQTLLGMKFPEIPQDYLQDSLNRTTYMLQNAATMEVTKDACSLNVRIVNQTGHKLPTGYAEGRRMWLHVEFRDDSLEPVAVRGHYDFDSADLTSADTKVYEIKMGLDAAMAALTGKPEGPSFHFALNNKIYKDNRIPPRGFTHAAFEAAQAPVVGAQYADGQFWDDTAFRIPPGATSAVVTLYYQTAGKEYVEFLRDENRTLPKPTAGDELYYWWEVSGKSAPVEMRRVTVTKLTPGRFADADCDGGLDLTDYGLLHDCLSGPGSRLSLGCEALDADLDGQTDLTDIAVLQRAFME